MQEVLLTLKNPLDLILGREFFNELPRSPGIYRMLGSDGELLYVGKAKDLRARLMSYRRIKLNHQSRKSLRLIHQIRNIIFELCDTEEAALVRENELLRSLKPPFNSANTQPETYFYFCVIMPELNQGSSLEDSHSFEISLIPGPSLPEEAAVFGAFKGLARCQRAFFALKRMFHLINTYPHDAEPEYPVHLFKRQRLSPHRNQLPKRWLNYLAGFLHGFTHCPLQKEPELVIALRELCDRIPHCGSFYQNWFAEDLEALTRFYWAGPYQNKQLKTWSSDDAPTIRQIEIDDLVVKRRFTKARSLSPDLGKRG